MPWAMASRRTPARKAEKSLSTARASRENTLGAAQNGTANIIRRLTRSVIEQPLRSSNPWRFLPDRAEPRNNPAPMRQIRPLPASHIQDQSWTAAESQQFPRLSSHDPRFFFGFSLATFFLPQHSF